MFYEKFNIKYLLKYILSSGLSDPGSYFQKKKPRSIAWKKST